MGWNYAIGWIATLPTELSAAVLVIQVCASLLLLLLFRLLLVAWLPIYFIDWPSFSDLGGIWVSVYAVLG
jgi:amino acid permease